jgi:hypothetical protein
VFLEKKENFEVQKMGRKNPQNGKNRKGKKKGGSRGTPQRHYGKIPHGQEPFGSGVDTAPRGKEPPADNVTSEPLQLPAKDDGIPLIAGQISGMTGGREVVARVKKGPNGTTITEILPTSSLTPVAPEVQVAVPIVEPVPPKTREQELAEKFVDLICEWHGRGGFPVHLPYQRDGRKKIAAVLSQVFAPAGIKLNYLNYFPDEMVNAVVEGWPLGEQGVCRAAASAFGKLEKEIFPKVLTETFLGRLPKQKGPRSDSVLVGAIFGTLKQFRIELTVPRIPWDILKVFRNSVNSGHTDVLRVEDAFEEILENYSVRISQPGFSSGADYTKVASKSSVST